jgi:hypothetical protein
MRRTTRVHDADGSDEPDGDDTGFGCGVWRTRWDGGGGGSVDADIDADGGVTVGKANRRLSRTDPSTTNLGLDRGRAWMDAVSTLAAADVAAATRAKTTTTTTEAQTIEVVTTTTCDACERRERALRETEDALRECRAVMAAMAMEPAVCVREVGCAERDSSRRTVWARVRLRRPVVDARGATPGGRARIDERASGGSTVVDGATARRSAVKTVDRGLTKSTSKTPDPDPVAVEEERVKMERMEKRRAERTAIMAKRSRARRAAKAARQAAAPVVSSSDTRDSRTGKPDWNDSVDVDAMPRRKTNEEYFAELDKLVRARRAEEAKERLKEARRKNRRRNRARKAAMEAKHVPVEHASAMEERTSDGDAATTRSSMDSERSFATAEAS